MSEPSPELVHELREAIRQRREKAQLALEKDPPDLEAFGLAAEAVASQQDLDGLEFILNSGLRLFSAEDKAETVKDLRQKYGLDETSQSS